ncbi:hypothetical protein C0J52_07018 [Blattella germanica]|nr:hypothetical protein C0J52_07018 [Blattella germanica]
MPSLPSTCCQIPESTVQLCLQLPNILLVVPEENHDPSNAISALNMLSNPRVHSCTSAYSYQISVCSARGKTRSIDAIHLCL